MSKSKKMCCECINWEMGDTWQTNQNSNPGQPVVISELGEDRVCYCHGVENDNCTLYWQFADSNWSTWQIPVDKLTPRLATDAEIAASYISACKAVAKQEYE